MMMDKKEDRRVIACLRPFARHLGHWLCYHPSLCYMDGEQRHGTVMHPHRTVAYLLYVNVKDIKSLQKITSKISREFPQRFLPASTSKSKDLKTSAKVKAQKPPEKDQRKATAEDSSSTLVWRKIDKLIKKDEIASTSMIYSPVRAWRLTRY